MKRLVSILLILLIGWCSSAAGQQPVAYGTFKILGIGGELTDPFIIVFGSYVSDGYQQDYCSHLNWYWPPGTTHTWWLNRNDMITFAAILSASRLNKNVFLSGRYDPQVMGDHGGYIGAKCRIKEFVTR